MPFQVRLTARAERDVEQAIAYLQKQSRTAAPRWHARLVKAVQSLEDQPQRCGLAPEAEDLGIELRQLLFGKERGVYRIQFTIERDVINVLHVRHAARRPLRPGDI